MTDPRVLEELVVAAQGGDDEAFNCIVQQCQDVAYYTALRYLGNAEWAQDAAQDAFLDAYRNLSSLREPRAFPAWFRRVIFKHCDRRTRRQRANLLSLDDAPTLASDGFGPEAMLERLQYQQAIRAAIRSLPEMYREVTELFYLQDYSYADIAAHLDLPLSTVKKRLYTARASLKERISPMKSTTYRPSESPEFADRVSFFIALKKHDLLQVRQVLRRSPQLATARTEWGVASDGWYWPLGTTALHWAASTGDQPLAELLLEQGVDVDIPDRGEASPLRRAVQMDQLELARWLLQQGADPNHQASNGQTPLHVAVIRNRPQLVDLLLQHGADTSLTDVNERTALDWALLKGRPDLARRLGHAEDVSATRPGISDLAKEAGIWETGVKIIDLMAPLRWGGRNGMFTPIAGIGIDVMLAELSHVMAAHYGGKTVLVGLERGNFTRETRLLQWRNCGMEQDAEAFFGPGDGSDARHQHVAEKALAYVGEQAAEGPVLFVVYTDLALAPGVMEIVNRAGELGNVTTLFVGIESLGAEPPALADLDAALTFDQARRRENLWPAIDPIRSYARTFADERHERVAREAKRLFARYVDLQVIYEHQGLSGFDFPLFGQAERQAAIRARRLHRFLSHPLVIAETWSAVPGEYVPLPDTLQTVERILNGELDDVPEDELSYIGNWSPKWT